MVKAKDLGFKTKAFFSIDTKNFIINEDEVYLEVIKLEGHYLKNRIVI